MDREAKRQRAAEVLGSVRSVNRATVLTILQHLEPECDTSRKDLAKDINVLSETLCHDIPVRTINPDASATLAVARVQELLPHIMIHCPGFRDVFLAALARHPNDYEHPWRMVVYMDEITPGNPLHLESHKKVTAIYSSFVELEGALRYEEAWMVNGCVRTTAASNILGGLSAIIKELMRAMFCGVDSIGTVGILIPGESPRLFFAILHVFIGDEAANKALWGHKSSSSFRPCFDCKNVVQFLEEPSAYLVDLACTDRAKFDSNSDADIWRDYDALAEAVAGGCTKARLKTLEKSRGMNHNPHGIIADLELRRVALPSHTTRDPMHVVLANGVMNVEIYLVLEALAKSMPGFSYAVVADFASCDWRFPRSSGSLAYTLSPAREKSSRKDCLFKASATEVLKLYPILRYFVQTVVLKAGLAREACESFLALCRVVDLMQRTKWHVKDSILRRLDEAIDAFEAIHCAFYGNEHLRPKHHYLFHITEQPRRDRFWLDCYTHERKHQLIKAAIQDIDNLASYERSCLKMVLAKTISQQCDFGLSKMEPPIQTHNLEVFGGAPCEVSRSMRFEGVHYTDKCVLMQGAVQGLIKVSLMFQTFFIFNNSQRHMLNMFDYFCFREERRAANARGSSTWLCNSWWPPSARTTVWHSA